MVGVLGLADEGLDPRVVCSAQLPAPQAGPVLYQSLYAPDGLALGGRLPAHSWGMLQRGRPQGAGQPSMELGESCPSSPRVLGLGDSRHLEGSPSEVQQPRDMGGPSPPSRCWTGVWVTGLEDRGARHPHFREVLKLLCEFGSLCVLSPGRPSPHHVAMCAGACLMVFSAGRRLRAVAVWPLFLSSSPARGAGVQRALRHCPLTEWGGVAVLGGVDRSILCRE